MINAVSFQRHVYVLPTRHCPSSSTLDANDSHSTTPLEPSGNHDYAWIFPRTFHVSPFNNRSGFYRLDVQDPFLDQPNNKTIKPRVKITLNQLTAEKETKLYAALLSSPNPRKVPRPITARNILAMVLYRQPWDLLLTSFRILKEAWVLHYIKQLAVYPRPEPHVNEKSEENQEQQRAQWHLNPIEADAHGIGRSIGFRPISSSETSAQAIMLHLIQGQLDEDPSLNISVDIQFADPARATIHLAPSGGTQPNRKFNRPCLVVKSSSPTFFLQLLMTSNPRLFVLMSLQQGQLTLSDSDLFHRLMTPSTDRLKALATEHQRSWVSQKLFTWVWAVRSRYLAFLMLFVDGPLPHQISSALPPAPGSPQSVLGQHHLTDMCTAATTTFTILRLLTMVLVIDKLERRVFKLVHARFLPGQEPWTVLKRTVDAVRDENVIGSRAESDCIQLNDKRFGSVLLEQSSKA